MDDLLLDHRVTADDVGMRLGVALAGWLGESRSRAQHRIVDGRVTVDGQVVAKSHKVVLGERVLVRPDPDVAPPTPPVVPIRWQDDHLLVIAKPADLVVHAGAGVRGPTLVDALRGQGVPLASSEDPDRPGIVHRLDRGTSGLLVVAKDPDAMLQLQAKFRVHDVHREYWALVEGHPDPPSASIDAPIIRSTSNRTAFTTGDDGRHAVSHYDTLTVHADTAEVAVTLETGRTHQVRVHLRAIGRPVVGDVLYNASPQRARALGLTRQALHARRLTFTHPITGQVIDLEEPLPADLVEARERAARR